MGSERFNVNHIQVQMAMVIKLLEIPVEDGDYSAIPTDVPMWLKPYVGAALRSGLLNGLEQGETFGADMPITEAEAAVMLQNALALSLTEVAVREETVPVWAADAVAVLAQNGLMLNGEGALTRARVAELLYQVSYLAVDAPGMQILRMQQ